jgi:hypothetical protein
MNNEDVTTVQNVDEQGIYSRHYTLITFNLETFLEERRKKEVSNRSKRAKYFLSNAFPQLGTEKNSAAGGLGTIGYSQPKHTLIVPTPCLYKRCQPKKCKTFEEHTTNRAVSTISKVWSKV